MPGVGAAYGELLRGVLAGHMGKRKRCKQGYPQTKTLCVAINGLSELKGVPSPTGHQAVNGYRAMAQRSKRYRDRGAARASFGPEIPPVTAHPEDLSQFS